MPRKGDVGWFQEPVCAEVVDRRQVLRDSPSPDTLLLPHAPAAGSADTTLERRIPLQPTSPRNRSSHAPYDELQENYLACKSPSSCVIQPEQTEINCSSSVCTCLALLHGHFIHRKECAQLFVDPCNYDSLGTANRQQTLSTRDCDASCTSSLRETGSAR